MKNTCFVIATIALILVGCETRSAQIRDPEQPPPARPKVTLMGITSILRNKSALLKMESPGDSSGPARVQSLTLSEHQKNGQIEVLEINEKSASVRLSNSGVVTLLTLEKDNLKSTTTSRD